MYVRLPSQEGVLGGDKNAYVLPCTHTITYVLMRRLVCLVFSIVRRNALHSIRT
jgi:hypothetical protein